MAILVLAEHDGAQIASATLATVTAAQKLGGPVHLLVAGDDVAAQAGASVEGVEKVLHLSGGNETLAEVLAPVLQAKAGGYSHVLAPATTFGKDVLPRAAALHDSQQVSDILEVVDADTYRRPVYAGNAIETIKSSDAVKFITVRPTAFAKVKAEGGSASIEAVQPVAGETRAQFVRLDASKGDRPELTSARVVVSGGRAFGSGDKFREVIEPLADKLNAAIGASRAAVDAGYVPNDYQVGQTGKVVAPELYIALGISGAIQHLAGMKDSKVIVAINRDENAPIFEVADYGLVGDVFELVPELTSKL